MGLQDSFVKTTPEALKSTLEREEQMKADLLEEMGITTDDVEYLRKTMLSADEAVCAKKEELETIRSHKSRKEDWEEFVDVKRRMGRVLHHTEIVRKLREVVPRLLVCRGGVENCIGFYVLRNMPVSEIPDYPLSAQKMKWTDVPVYIGWLELGYSPEYEIDIVDDVNVAIAHRAGWRTLLLRLIARRLPHCTECEHNPKTHPRLRGRPTSLATEESVYRVFGYPSNGPTASNFRKQLWEFRNGYK
jgi:hypothetical protein